MAKPKKIIVQVRYDFTAKEGKITNDKDVQAWIDTFQTKARKRLIYTSQLGLVVGLACKLMWNLYKYELSEVKITYQEVAVVPNSYNGTPESTYLVFGFTKKGELQIIEAGRRSCKHYSGRQNIELETTTEIKEKILNALLNS